MPASHRLLAPCIVALAFGPAASQVSDPEIWIVSRDAGRISIVDQPTFTNETSFDIGDPDGDGTVDPAWDLCFSTSSTRPGTHAFVTQGKWLHVIDVATRATVALHDIASLTGFTGLELRGCGASPPREFQTTGGSPIVRSHLHLAATTAGDDARFVVADQELLITGTANPVVDDGHLARSATAQDVQVLDTPDGARYERAWYSAVLPPVAGPGHLLALLVAKSDQLADPWTVQDVRTVPLSPSTPTPDVLRFGAPAGRELPVLTTAALGTLENLDTGGRCSPGGDLRVARFTGPGPNSYTGLALDWLAGELVVIDPKNCSTLRYAVGPDPTDVTTLGLLDWREAYVVSRGANTISRLTNQGSLTTIPLDLPIAGPTAVGIPLRRRCSVENIRVDRHDEDGDGQFDDYLVSWDGVDCPAGTRYEVGCYCTSTAPGCPCIPCDCSLPDPGPGCLCPGVIAQMPPVADPPDDPVQVLVLDAGDPDVSIQAPWKMLGDTKEEEFVHEDQAGTEASWNYTVEPKDDP